MHKRPSLRESDFTATAGIVADPIDQTFIELSSLLGQLQRHLTAAGSAGGLGPGQLLRARRLRERFVSANLLSDPAWDMLLELYECHISQIRISISALCDILPIPPSTALRWFKKLQDEGLADRNPDKFDARRSWVFLTSKGIKAMEDYFTHLAFMTGSNPQP